MARRKRKARPIRKLDKGMRGKMLLMFGTVTLGLVGLVGRVAYIDYTNGNNYLKKVLSLQSYDSQTIPFQRGDILDAHGTVLATSVAVYNVILDSSMLTSLEDGEKTDEILDLLAECFPDLDREELETYVEEHPNNMYKVLEKKKTYEELQPLLEARDKTDDSGSYVNTTLRKAVYTETVYVRDYPEDSLASSIIGFVSSGNVGTTGLENYYDNELNGSDGREYGYLNSDNSVEKTVIEPENGDNLITSIDANVQMIVEDKMKEFYDTYTDNYRSGGGFENCGVIIENAKTGEIIAMADYPTFDLNNPRDLTEIYTQEDLDAMTSEDQLTALNQLWNNFCITSTYEPGSVQKPLTISAGFETGALTEDMTFYCDGGETFDGYDGIIRCDNIFGHGEETIEGALKDSCNDSLMQMSYLIGIDNFADFQTAFGMGQKTGIDLPGETSCASLIYSKEVMTKIDCATNSFGQSYNCTMIQMANAFTSVINGGYYYEPHLVTKITDEDGNTISTIEPTLLRQTVSRETSDLLKSYLKAVVDSGTGKYAKVDGYSMGGKTGTAETASRDKTDYVVSFIGFAPYDDPEIVIYCVMDRPNAEDQAHSNYAQNIVREILKEVYPYLNIYPDEEKTGINAGLDITGTVPPDYSYLEHHDYTKTAAETAAETAAAEDTDTTGNAAAGTDTTDADAAGTASDAGSTDNSTDGNTGTTGDY